MSISTVTYKVLIEHNNSNIWVDVEVPLDQKSKSKAKNRSRAAVIVREQYPNCSINQIIY